MFHSRAPRWRRVPEFIWRTVGVLVRERPQVLYVQNPSVILTAFALALKPLLRYRLVVDAHNAGVYRFEKEQKYTAWMLPAFHRFADLTIVTNEHVARIVENNGGKTFVLPDPLPQFTHAAAYARVPADSGPFIVTFICSYAADEPYLEVFSAARLLPLDIVLRVTGNPARLTAAERAQADDRVTLLGFLPEREFVSRLLDSDLIMDLTTFCDCLVCGAYEATSLEVPMILSDTPALRGHFRDGAVFVDNSAAGIAKGILAARAQWKELRRGVCESKARLTFEWEDHRRALISVLKDL